MFNLLFSISLFFGFIALVFVAPALMNLTLVRISKDYKITPNDAVLCCIPIVNHFYGWRSYAGTVSPIGVTTIITIITFILRSIIAVTVSNFTVQTISIVLVVISIVAFWLSSAVCNFIVFSDSGLYGIFFRLFMSAFSIIGQLYIGKFLPNVMKSYMKSKKGNLYGD